ncbi:pentatricopeptide repeat-containing protein At3g09040, mitochondrial-like [Selaginella moellendorffii]|uniref:pentatricopeptide repeat-containing protein At3g09040, mitochondrial-like n=1 Tax=Selaginella moellendorffii TaxID=88036 RepID=UPI000D1D0C92|nr:pentatricopeptide repeat-containing protein At3g09040, mitochondrial-like [Selaginella moellendorffii]|eukprot:XP_024541590.1 pentatricopeptide repeat-containing protein At3g09040, mitochondrial-like [Selaginella moellendorffii]
MDLEGVTADTITISAALEACTNQKSLREGRALHSAIASHGFLVDSMVKNNLVNMYGKCGSIDDAQSVFDSIWDKNLISWNVMISALVHNERGEAIVVLWKTMLLEGFKPDKVSFVTFIDACANLAALDEGVLAHRQASSQGLESNRVVGNTLVNMYGKCGKVELGRDFFEGMPDRDAVSWNTMIAGYVLHNHNVEALELFKLMDLEGVGATKVTFVTTLDACWKLDQTRVIHEAVRDSGLEIDEVLGRALMNAYRACGSLDEVRQVFDQVSFSSGGYSALLWNGLLSSFSCCDDDRSAARVFIQMQLEGVKSDKLTLISTLDSCVTLSNLKLGEIVHACIVELGLEHELFLRTALINMYGKCGQLQQARNLFDSMKAKDSVAWNAMLSSYAHNGRALDAIHLFLCMDLEGEKVDGLTIARVLDACGETSQTLALAEELGEGFSYGDFDIQIGNSLLNVYAKSRDLDAAKCLFERMKNKDVVSFNTLMGIYAQLGLDSDCVKTFHGMQLQGVRPNNISYANVLDACSNLSALTSGKAIHESMKASGITPDLVTETALVNMYGKCGGLELAWKIFQSMRNRRDFVSWNAVIAAFAQHGHGEQTLQLLWRMQQEGVKPDGISFLVTMAACSHAGFLDEAIELFVSMATDHCLRRAATHLGCMIDLLGRSSRLSEAEELIRKLPPVMEVPASWKIFLNSCKEQGDGERGERAAELAVNSLPGDKMPYLLLSNLYVQTHKRW